MNLICYNLQLNSVNLCYIMLDLLSQDLLSHTISFICPFTKFKYFDDIENIYKKCSLLEQIQTLSKLSCVNKDLNFTIKKIYSTSILGKNYLNNYLLITNYSIDPKIVFKFNWQLLSKYFCNIKPKFRKFYFNKRCRCKNKSNGKRCRVIVKKSYSCNEPICYRHRYKKCFCRQYLIMNYR